MDSATRDRCRYQRRIQMVVREPDSATAEGLIGSAMIAPDFLLLECGNAIWKQARRNSVEPSTVSRSLAVIEQFVDLMPTGPLIWDALVIARTIDHAIYDCIFLVLADRENCPFVTADAKFLNKVKAAALPIQVTLLADWQPG